MRVVAHDSDCVYSVDDRSYVFFFSSRRRHTILQGDWSSDVCSSDLCGSSSKNTVLMDAGVVADRKRGGVDKADTCTVAKLRVQIGHQWHQHGGHQLHEALIAHQGRKLAVQVTLNILRVIGFEGAVMGLLEQDEDGHDFTGIQLGRTQALSLP